MSTQTATTRALRALQDAEACRLSFSEFRKASGVKTRAYYPFADRLLREKLITPYGDLSRDVGYELTFGGMRYLAHQEV